jgi:hypothetical protein
VAVLQGGSVGRSFGAAGTAGSVTELGVSQYSFGESGTSACTVIACAVVKLLLAKFKSSPDIPDLTALTQAVQDGVTYYRSLPAAARSHLSMDELGPYMTQGVTSVVDTPIQGILSTPNCFQDLFAQARQWAAPGKHIAIVITKPPETVSVILPPANAAPGAKYIFFDSHSRPQFGFSGAYIVQCDGEEGLVHRLEAVFQALLMEGGSEDYMQMMYDMFEGSVFQCK